MSRKYSVGYAKPPAATRFKLGKSGNPKGRPKGSLNLSTVLNRELNQFVTVRENGASSRVRKKTAIVKALFAKALGGDVRAAAAVLDLTARYEGDTVEAQQPTIDNDEMMILQRFAPRALKSIKAKKTKRRKS